nr:MAG: RNA-dependent RNA polymerase [Inner Mongolia sediment hanta-like virus]
MQYNKILIYLILLISANSTPLTMFQTKTIHILDDRSASKFINKALQGGFAYAASFSFKKTDVFDDSYTLDSSTIDPSSFNLPSVSQMEVFLEVLDNHISYQVEISSRMNLCFILQFILKKGPFVEKLNIFNSDDINTRINSFLTPCCSNEETNCQPYEINTILKTGAFHKGWHHKCLSLTYYFGEKTRDGNRRPAGHRCLPLTANEPGVLSVVNHIPWVHDRLRLEPTGSKKAVFDLVPNEQSGFCLLNPPGEGLYCGSFAVEHASGCKFTTEPNAAVDQLGLSCLHQTTASAFVCFQEDLKLITIYTVNKAKKGPVVRLYLSGGHYQVVISHTTVGWKVETNTYLTKEELTYYTLVETISEQASCQIDGILQSYKAENKSHGSIIFDMPPSEFIDYYHDAMFDIQAQEIIAATIANSSHIKSNLNSYSCGLPFYRHQYGLTNLPPQPKFMISIDEKLWGCYQGVRGETTDLFGQRFILCDEEHDPVLLDFDRTSLYTTLVGNPPEPPDEPPLVNAGPPATVIIPVDQPSDVSTLESKSNLREALEERRVSRSKTVGLPRKKKFDKTVNFAKTLMENILEEGMMSVSSYPTYPDPSISELMFSEELAFLKPYNKTTNNTWGYLTDWALANGRDISNILLYWDENNQERKSSLWAKEMPEVVKLGQHLLDIRGAVYENLVLYHKSMLGAGERSMCDFILDLNSSRLDISKRLLNPNLSSCRSKSEVVSAIEKMFIGKDRTDMAHLIFNKTPDCIQVDVSGEWVTLIVSDPSTAGNVMRRKADKQLKYHSYRKLLNGSSTTSFKLESPVCDSSANNMSESLSNLVFSRPLDNKMVSLAADMIKMISRNFSVMKAENPELAEHFNAPVDSPDLGELDSLVGSLTDYLTDRDLKLTGLTRDQAIRLFDVDKKLDYEEDTYQDKMFEKLKKLIVSRDSLSSGSLAPRTDVFFTPEEKSEAIKKALISLKEVVPEFQQDNESDVMGPYPTPSVFLPSDLSSILECEFPTESCSDKVNEFLVSNINLCFDDWRRNKTNVELKDAFNEFRDRTKLTRRALKPKEISNAYSLFNSDFTTSRITGKNKFVFRGTNNKVWRELVMLEKTHTTNSKAKQQSKIKNFNKHSVKRIERLIAEMEETSAGDPLTAILEIIEASDLTSCTNYELEKMDKYFSTKGSQSMISAYRMAQELNLLLTSDMGINEVSVSNLGLKNVIAIVAPGCRLSDSSETRLVKFLVKRDQTMTGQKYRGEDCGDWWVQVGFTRVSHKRLLHAINMPLCLTPLFNEQHTLNDSIHDLEFKRSVTQMYWMSGDSTTNKMLGVVRYLSLMVFAFVCQPDKLITGELKNTELPWRKDVHVYTIDRIINNLPKQLEAVKTLDAVDGGDEGSMRFNSEFSFPRLLHQGNHKTFQDMLNEFYMYYTWNKLQVSQFEGNRRVFNKLLKIRSKCLEKISPCLKNLKDKPDAFTNLEYHLNCGVAEPLKTNRNGVGRSTDLNKIKYVLSQPEDTPGLGYAPYLYSSTCKWMDEVNAHDLLSSTNFQPYKYTVEGLSNTRGSLVRTELVNRDLPILCPKLGRVKLMDESMEEKKKLLQSRLDRGKILRKDYEKMIKETELIRLDEHDDDFEPVEAEPLTQIESRERYIEFKDSKNSTLKKKLSKYISKLGYDNRSKCLITTLEALIKHGKDRTKEQLDLSHPMTIDTMLANFVKNRLDMVHGISPKTQHLSDRELRVMDIESKACMKTVEDLARRLNSLDSRETSTTDKRKQLTQEQSSKRVDDLTRTGKVIPLKLSADKSKWGPGVLPTEFIPILRAVSHKHPQYKETCLISMFMVMKLQSKRVLVPKQLLTNWWTHNLSYNRMKEDLPHVEQFMREFDPTKRCTFDNINDMGQGILNAFTSFKHLATTTYSNQLFYSIYPKTKLSYTSCQLSSDDSLEMQTFPNCSEAPDMVKTWLTVKTCCWRLSNIISNKKKTAGCQLLSEYNSNFCYPPTTVPPNIKQIISAGLVNFQYSWSDTVKSKLSELKSASENGVSNSTVRLSNLLLRKFYRRLFGVDVIERHLKTIVGPDLHDEAIARLNSGAIEFGNFPVVDPVLLNTVGSYEIMLSTLNDTRQVELLTDLTKNVFFGPDSEEEDKDYSVNTIGLKSMSFRLYKISQLESNRERIQEVSPIKQQDVPEYVKKDPFFLLKRPTSISQQMAGLLNTLFSSSMQSAYTNFDGLRGMMRVMGMRYSAKYGSKGTLTENLSFMTITLLMNMYCHYDISDDRLKEFTKLCKDGDTEESQVSLLRNIVINSNRKAGTSYTLPPQFMVMKELCENSIDELKSLKPSDITSAGNPALPTLMNRPAWNNDYFIKEQPVSALEILWSNNPMISCEVGKTLSEYDKYVLTDRYKIPEDLNDLYSQWGVEAKPENLCRIASWLNRLCKNSYKPGKLVYGRATTSGGFRRMVSDMYQYNAGTDYTLDGPNPSIRSPHKWIYGDDLHDFLVGCCSLVRFCDSSNEFRIACKNALIDINRQREQEGSKLLVLFPEIISDSNVHSDIRFIVSVIKDTEESMPVSPAIMDYLRQSVSLKNYRYLVPQRKIKATNQEGVEQTIFTPDTNCSVEYYGSFGKLIVTHRAGFKPKATLQTKRRRPDMQTVCELIDDFFKTKCSLSYMSSGFKPKIFQKLKYPQKLAEETNAGFIDLSKDGKAIFEKTKTRNCFKLYITFLETMPGKPPMEEVDIMFSWEEKRYIVSQATRYSRVISARRTVLKYSGTTISKNISTASMTNLFKAIMSRKFNDNISSKLAIAKLFDDLTPNKGHDQNEGAAMHSVSIIKELKDGVKLVNMNLSGIHSLELFKAKELLSERGVWDDELLESPSVDLYAGTQECDKTKASFRPKGDPSEGWSLERMRRNISAIVNEPGFTVTVGIPIGHFQPVEVNSSFFDMESAVEIAWASDNSPVTLDERISMTIDRNILRWSNAPGFFEDDPVDPFHKSFRQHLCVATIEHISPYLNNLLSVLSEEEGFDKTVTLLAKANAVGRIVCLLGNTIKDQTKTGKLKMLSQGQYGTIFRGDIRTIYKKMETLSKEGDFSNMLIDYQPKLDNVNFKDLARSMGTEIEDDDIIVGVLFGMSLDDSDDDSGLW